MAANGITVGVTVLGDFLLSEGIDQVVENLLRAGVTAVATNPTVTTAAEEGQGSFQPPVDAGSSPRTFDRPLFGKHALWVQSAPSFHPNPDLYRRLKYGPRRTGPLTDEAGHRIAEFIEKAQANGLEVYFQIGAAQPTGLEDDDRPRQPDDSVPKDRMADTACLASQAVRDYNRAYLQDLVEHYPSINGFRIDWPEYPCYTLAEVFQDFHPDVARFAVQQGWDFDRIKSEVLRFWTQLKSGHVPPGLLQSSRKSSGFAVGQLLQHYPGILEWLRLKAALSTDLIADWRTIVDQLPGSQRRLIAHAFMPPWSVLTGFDFASAASLADEVAPKLYTMHWSQMVDFWARPLLSESSTKATPERLWGEHELVRSIAEWTDLGDEIPADIALSDYGYPAPDEPHPIPDEPQVRKLNDVLNAVRNCPQTRANVVPLVHGYGPLEDFRRRLTLITQTQVDGVWLNRYGYLSDEKLQVVRQVGDALKKGH